MFQNFRAQHGDSSWQKFRNLEKVIYVFFFKAIVCQEKIVQEGNKLIFLVVWSKLIVKHPQIFENGEKMIAWRSIQF